VPTNVGTGHPRERDAAPAGLKLTGEIEKSPRRKRNAPGGARPLRRRNRSHRDFYQISNQTTLGKSEDEIISDFKNQVIPRSSPTRITRAKCS